MEPADFCFYPSDDELRAYAKFTPLERLQRLDDLRRFVLMLREAPTVHPQAAEPAPDPYPAEPAD